jgi:hypothetical protein
LLEGEVGQGFVGQVYVLFERWTIEEQYQRKETEFLVETNQ